MAEVLDKKVSKEQEPWFGKKERKLISDPLDENNPITVQVLGICSALAVTSLVLPSIVISIAVIFVCAFANLFTSLLRNHIPTQVRMIVQLVIIATLVSIVDMVLKATLFDVWKQLAVFISLIVTNCIVMGRLEAFALANKPWRSFLDGIGNGLGYGLILIGVAVIREIFGKGTLFAGAGFMEIKIIGASPDYIINTLATSGFDSYFGWYQNNNLFVLPPAAMFIIAIMIWVHRSWRPQLVDIS